MIQLNQTRAEAPQQRGRSPRRPKDFSMQVWTLVARRGMTPQGVADYLETSTWRVERIVVGVSRRNARLW